MIETINELLNRAVALHQAGDLTQAETLYLQILELEPKHDNSLHLLGVLYHQQEKHTSAIALIKQAITVNAAPEYYNNLGLAYKAENEVDLAITQFQTAIHLKADYAEPYNNLGAIYQTQDKYDLAIHYYQQALKYNADYTAALTNLINLLKRQQKNEELVKLFGKLSLTQPDNFLILNEIGVLLQNKGELDEALGYYQRALELKPDDASLYNNIGCIFQHKGELEQAIHYFEKAIERQDDLAITHFNMGELFRCQGLFSKSIDCYQKALHFKPDSIVTFDSLFTSKINMCDWSDYQQHIEKIIDDVKKNNGAYQVFTLFSITDSAQLHDQCAKQYVKVKCDNKYKHDKIRIAYISADFREHPVSRLMVGLFEQHDRTRFDIIAISLKNEKQTAFLQRVISAFDQFIDVSAKSNLEVVDLIRRLNIDIAVDLMGHTRHSRTNIFSYRVAPIQINYLGFPSTMGADYIDYIIADSFLIPKDQQAYYSENIIYLPECFQVNDDKQDIVINPTRLEVGLPETGFVFCSFNHVYKISPTVFSCWMRLLQQVEHSVLWILSSEPIAQHNLLNEAKARGITEERIIFAPKTSKEQHLARFQLADLFLDTFPCNAGTTASDALSAGVPIVTCSGHSMPSRMAGSLLTTMNLSELVTFNLEDYEALALILATTPDLLAEIRAKLAVNRQTSPLFNTDRFRRHIEAAYIEVMQRQQRGEKPSTLYVPHCEDFTA